MPAYSIAEVDILDPAAMNTYRQIAVPAITAYGGRLLFGGQPEVAEGDWPEDRRLTVFEFPDPAARRAWYDSPEYAPARALIRTAMRRNLLFLSTEETKPPS